MSGIACTDRCVEEYNKFKLQNGAPGAKRRAYIIYRINGEKIDIDEEGPEDADWNQFVEALTKNEKDGAYGIYDFNTTTEEGRKLQKIIFVAWAPDTIPIKSKMLYGSTRESFKQALGSGLAYVIQASDIADLDESDITEMVHKGR